MRRATHPLNRVVILLLAAVFAGSCTTAPPRTQADTAQALKAEQKMQSYYRNNTIYQPSDEVLTTLSYSQAKATIMAKENQRWPSFPGLFASWVRNISITPDKITWDWVCPESKYASMTANRAYFQKIGVWIGTANHDGEQAYRVYLGEVKRQTTGRKSQLQNGPEYFWESKGKDEAVSLANAFFVLKRYAEGYKEDDEKFADEARKYREAAVKPPLSEETRRCQVMAEDALNNKEFEKALDYYLKGLASDPMWPQGQFNAAIIAGELKIYDTATLHMKHYLELCPESPDAKAARDRLYLWEGKEKEENK